ncbi:MAG: dihydropteroate synthase [Bacillota bacterium]|nr:dihydropteroate synthase [Bacillota bacterium]MDW7684747.1 dihydropteroate synthase [Bacillota bacterium]
MQNKLTLKGRTYNLEHNTLIMGILNVTPDSFSDGGHFYDTGKAIEHALRMAAEGAHIIDIGGESTRPGHQSVCAAEEAARVIPVVRAVCAATEIPVSIDTYKAPVAREALAAGAAMLNDVWGGQKDKDMLTLAAEANVPICLMHNRDEALYDDLMAEIKEDLLESAAMAQDFGVRKENIILDPGIGFGKTPAHNLVVLQRLEELTALGYPLLLGTSRKSVIGKVLDLPVEERVEGTAATVAYGITRGSAIVRVHDVQHMSRVARMTDAMLRGGFYYG